MVVALFCGDTVASEASWGSLRYLLAIPVPRARLLGGQADRRAGCTRRLALLTLAGTALLLGTLRYGWHPLGSTIAAEIPPGEGLLRLLGILGYLAVTLLVVAGLAFLLSVLTDAALGAVGGAVLLWILSSILDQIEALGDDPQLPADPLQRRLAGPALHPDADRRHGQGRDRRDLLRHSLLGAGVLPLHPQGHHFLESPASLADGALTRGRLAGDRCAATLVLRGIALAHARRRQRVRPPSPDGWWLSG